MAPTNSQAPNQAPQATAASMFKGGIFLPLPSGAIVEMQPYVSIGSMIVAGRIPNPLIPAAYKVAKGEWAKVPQKKEEDERTEEDINEDMREYWAVIDAVVIEAVKSPQLVLDPAQEVEENVWIGRFHDADKQEIYDHTHARMATLNSFRVGTGSTNDGQAGAEVRDDPGDAAGPTGDAV